MSVYSGCTNYWLNKNNTNALNGLVTNGLVLALDAGRTLSYPGSGTTWTNLGSSGSTNNGTLTNGPTYDNSNGGCLVFAAASKTYVAAGNLGNFYTQGTIEYWMNSTDVVNYRNPFHTHYLGGNVGIRFEQNTGSTSAFYVVIGNDSASYTLFDYAAGTNLVTNNWYHVVLIWNSSTNNAIGYLNGTQKFNGSCTTWATTLPSITIGSGIADLPERWYTGKIAQVRMYNTALSATEVSQNFNAFRKRFGI